MSLIRTFGPIADPQPSRSEGAPGTRTELLRHRELRRRFEQASRHLLEESISEAHTRCSLLIKSRAQNGVDDNLPASRYDVCPQKRVFFHGSC